MARAALLVDDPEDRQRRLRRKLKALGFVEPDSLAGRANIDDDGAAVQALERTLFEGLTAVGTQGSAHTSVIGRRRPGCKSRKIRGGTHLPCSHKSSSFFCC